MQAVDAGPDILLHSRCSTYVGTEFMSRIPLLELLGVFCQMKSSKNPQRFLAIRLKKHAVCWLKTI